MDFVNRALSRQAWRCRTCRHRFYASTGGTRFEPPTKSRHTHQPRTQQLRISTRTRKRLIEAALFLAMLVVFYVFLRYITQEPGMSSSGGL